MLLTVTPNPAIDRLLIVPGFRHSDVCRVAERIDSAGGKGFNVTRAARTLGVPVRTCALLGGENGRQIAALAQAEGLEGAWSWLSAGESRICLLITDPDARDHLTINETGPTVTPADWTAFMELVWKQARGAAFVAISGSVPPGVTPGQYLELVRGLPLETFVCIDTSGPTLAAALDLPVDLLKINVHELSAALGQTISTPDEARAAAVEVVQRGPLRVIVTLGAQGAVAIDARGAWYARTPPLDPISPVGSGDAALAGVIAVLHTGGSLAEALRMGVACGAANTLVVGAGRMRRDDVARLLAATDLRTL
ncbi:MAG: hexose kinase [Roseiflexus sp.]|nr:hexose kinase [Roseiflexus sp.]MCS7287872.1 hexose kinase [Roseiflexus sp.]MDW8147051.1 hexose kinase [Roseiflexaceae bacterium]MDW8232539.1 hexose kinase [Roseiflexaceae bacterium]